MQKLLSGKRIIVTGGHRGLGLAISTALAVDGAQIVVVGRTEDGVKAAAARARELGATTAYCVADITDPASAERIVQASLEELGGLDGVINNAGVFIWKKFVDLTPEDYRRTIDTNLSGPFYLAQAAAKAMIQQGEGGSIVNIASIHGKIPDPNVVAHCASKAGLIGLTQAMAEALREHDIRVNAICPGAIQPNSGDRRSSSPQEKCTQSDVATVAVFLSSDLSAAITGSAIDIPGSTRPVIKL